MTGVRWREDTGFEGRCEYCRSWWPLEVSNWRPRGGLRRCAACYREYHRLKEAGRSAIQANKELKLANSRIAYRLNREERLEYNRRWKAANRERIAAYNRQYRERRRAAA